MIALENRLYNLGEELSERQAKIVRQMNIVNKKLNDEVYKVYSLTKSEADSIEDTFQERAKGKKQ
jgi:hypothetical protein